MVNMVCSLLVENLTASFLKKNMLFSKMHTYYKLIIVLSNKLEGPGKVPCFNFFLACELGPLPGPFCILAGEYTGNARPFFY